ATTLWRKPSQAGAIRRRTATICCSRARPAWASPRPIRRNPNTRCSGRSSWRSPRSGAAKPTFRVLGARRSRRGGQVEQRRPEGLPRLLEQRRHRGGECIVLGGRELDDLAALRHDRLACLLFLLHVQLALKRNRIRYRAAYAVLNIRRPGIEGGAMQEDWPRNVEVIAQRVEAVELVHAVGHRIRERIFLRVKVPGGDWGDRLREVHRHGHRAEQFERLRLHLARQDTDSQAGEVRRRAHWPYAVRDVPKAVLEPAKDAEVRALLDL